MWNQDSGSTAQSITSKAESLSSPHQHTFGAQAPSSPRTCSLPPSCLGQAVLVPHSAPGSGPCDGGRGSWSVAGGFRPGAGGPGPTATLLSISRNRVSCAGPLPPRSPHWAARPPHPSHPLAWLPRPRPPGLKAGALSIRALPLPTPRLIPLLIDLETKAKGRLVNNGITLGAWPDSGRGPCWPQALAQHPHPSLGLYRSSPLFQGFELYALSSFVENRLCTRRRRCSFWWLVSRCRAFSSGHAPPLSRHTFVLRFLSVCLSLLGIYNLKIIRQGKTEQQGAKPSGL